MDSTAFLVIAVVAIVIQSFLLFLAFFEPGLRYAVCQPASESLHGEDFLRLVEILGNAQAHRRTRIEVLTNGEIFYEAEVAAIRAARHSINMEAYIFQRGEVARRFLDALVERARAGVRVHMVLDAIGSFGTRNAFFKALCEAGGRVEWYHPLRWHTWPRINNRTHRELLIIDGQVGFIGGAGIADHWLTGRRQKPRWRDTMFRVEGDAVTSLQSTFVENWLEASGELLTSPEYFPVAQYDSQVAALVIDSSPSSGRSTRARMVYQTLLASARKSIAITTPYFLPDRSLRSELIRALQERGVRVTVITPGQQTDHLLTRRSSRRIYGELLKSGAKIYEYQPSMIHTKTMVVDEVWSVVGSTNFDHRSFGLNDEVNLAVWSPELAARLDEDFALDLKKSRLISYENWQRRSYVERFHEWLGWILERQQ